MFRYEFEKSKEISIDHYRSKYIEPPLPPIWTTVEILSFGQAVKFTKGLTRKYQNAVSRPLGEDATYILNWLHCLSALRNICAHHSRLWNREQTFFVKTSHRDYEMYFVNNKKLFNYLVVLQILLNKINPTSSWLEKLTALIEEHHISVEFMGFPPDWEKRLRTIKNLA
jgi:abortive infection bacteriophage resistance protein